MEELATQEAQLKLDKHMLYLLAISILKQVAIFCVYKLYFILHYI